MNHRMSWWVVFIASVWMSVMVTVLEGKPATGKRWALLVAGSNGYENYRHQADVCHAYQILKKGGLKDENIIVFMYDDIAFNEENPRPGVIINKPDGPNIYNGVPKDYIGDDVNLENFFAVLSGNASALTGGSGKVLNSGPNDVIFIYYTDHGGAGEVGMPDGSLLWGNVLVDALKKKHAANSYKKMVIYLEACESGSMFEGLLPKDINIYVTTAANASENSYAFYCPDLYPPSPPGYTTCLGDVYSIAWMEDSDINDRTKETLKQQYVTVRQRTLTGHKKGMSSHVMQYGEININNDFLVTYLGANPADHNVSVRTSNVYSSEPFNIAPTGFVNQRDVHLLHLRRKLEKAPDGSKDKLKAKKELDVEIAHREHIDNSVHLIGDILFGEEKSSTMMGHVRPAGHALVDDWNCLKTLIKTYESHCGTLSTYGRKYSRAFANMCNAGIMEKQMVAASSQACLKKNQAP